MIKSQGYFSVNIKGQREIIGLKKLLIVCMFFVNWNTRDAVYLI